MLDHSSDTRLKSISIGTWNIDWAHPDDPDLYVRKLDQNPADVWVLTETKDAIRPSALSYFTHGPVRPCDDCKKWTPTSRWVSIWSRWPCKTILAEADPTRVVCARIEPPGSIPLIVYGTVLPWNADVLYGAGAKLDAIKRQFEEMLKLKSEHHGCHFIVAGDFNQWMWPPSSGRETLQGAVEAGLAELNLTCVTATSHFRMSWSPPIIDHIAASVETAGRFTFKSAWEATPGLSDHGGVVVEYGADE